ncbi:MAG: hypothetical protein ACP5G1_00100 [Nanopusillaceae archaeon]
MIIKKFEDIETGSIGLLMHLFDDFVISSKSIESNIKKLNLDLKIYTLDIPIVYPYFIEFEDKIIIAKNSPEELKDLLRKFFDLIEIDVIENLIGNVFLIGKNGIIYSRAKIEDVELISKKLGLPAYKIKSKYYIGSISRVHKNKLLISQEEKESNINKIKEITGYKVETGSVNFGSPYLRYGIEINKDYLIVGKYSTGHEIVRIEEFFSA